MDRPRERRTMRTAPSSITLSVRAHANVLVEAYQYSAGTVESLERHVHQTSQIAIQPAADPSSHHDR